MVDSDYRGEIKVILHNQSPNPITIPAHSKIAQFIFEKAQIPLLQQVNNLPSTIRGTKGFGSTNNEAAHTPNQQGLPNTRIQTFRLDHDSLLIYDKSKHKSKARRVAAPLRTPFVHPNDLQYWNHPDRIIEKQKRNNITDTQCNKMKASSSTLFYK